MEEGQERERGVQLRPTNIRAVHAHGVKAGSESEWVSECECERCAARDEYTLTPCLTRMKHTPYNPYTRADVAAAPSDDDGDV